MADDIVIVFDLGGVLIDWNPRYLYQKIFMGDDSKVDFFLEQICPLEWNTHQDRGRSIQEAVKERVEKYPAYEPLIRSYYSRWEEMIAGPIQGTVEILKKLRECGYPLAALSNWSAETFPLVADRFPFLAWFDPLVISGAVGLVKPEPGIYRHLLEELDYHPSRCLFIDDRKENVAVAEQHGLSGIHFRSPRQLEADLRVKGLLNGWC